MMSQYQKELTTGLHTTHTSSDSFGSSETPDMPSTLESLVQSLLNQTGASVENMEMRLRMESTKLPALLTWLERNRGIAEQFTIKGYTGSTSWVTISITSDTEMPF